MGSLVVAGDRWVRMAMKQPVIYPYPRAPKMVEYIVIQHDGMLEVPTLETYDHEFSTYPLPDKGVIVGVAFAGGVGANIGVALDARAIYHAMVTGLDLMHMGIMEFLPIVANVNLTKWKDQYRELWVPVDDDDYLRVACSADNTAGLGTQTYDMFTTFYVIKED
ncbi:hypothetical protein ES705_43802 [subsurface metagenome]